LKKHYFRKKSNTFLITYTLSTITIQKGGETVMPAKKAKKAAKKKTAKKKKK